MPAKPYALFAALFVAILPVHAADRIESCLEKANTQLEINLCDNNEQSIADKELNLIYQAVLKKHQSNKKFIEKLKTSQRAWVKWRDAEMEALFPEHDEPGFYGSSFSSCWSNQLAALTRARNSQLLIWLEGVEEGEICSGSYPIKP